MSCPSFEEWATTLTPSSVVPDWFLTVMLPGMYSMLAGNVSVMATSFASDTTSCTVNVQPYLPLAASDPQSTPLSILSFVPVCVAVFVDLPKVAVL